MAVAPEHQCKGIGSAFVRAGLSIQVTPHIQQALAADSVSPDVV
jgi:predicted N-acetyltransferase YhbS